MADLLQHPPQVIAGFGPKMALSAFQLAAARVPAYRDFLAKHGVEPSSIETLDDFERLPLIDKRNYFQAYPLEARCLDGDLGQMHRIISTSGSTGAQCHIPMLPEQEAKIPPALEMLGRQLFDIGERSTLLVICFALSTSSAGMLAAGGCLEVARKPEYRMTVVTPGVDFEETLRVIRALGAKFDQVVMFGYPPMLEEVIDRGVGEGIDWPALKVKLWTGGDAVSERWRDRMMSKIGSERAADFPNLFGTSEAGVVGFETPTVVALRRAASADPELLAGLVGERGPAPIFMQYMPMARYFEAVDGELVLTAGSLGMPLVRYNLHDRGGLLAYEQVPESLRSSRDLPLPLFYVFGRTDGVLLCGVNLYIADMQSALEDPSLEAKGTGRFKFKVDEDEALSVKVELRPGVVPDDELRRHYEGSLLENLRRSNREYSMLCDVRGERAWPRVILRAHGTEEFAARVKNKRVYLER